MSGDDYEAWLNDRWEQPDHECPDCGEGFWGDGPICNPCLDRRDAHSSALELRMVKVTLPPPPVPLVVEVALVSLVQPAGYGVWLASLDANARYGADALARAWYVAPLPYLQHLITVTPARWTALQALARKAA
jgi:hypothetical protein